MKRVCVFAVAVLGLISCSNIGESTAVPVDSLGKKFDKAAEKLWDSTKQKAKDVRDTIKKRLD
jgi:hypothetical protein